MTSVLDVGLLTMLFLTAIVIVRLRGLFATAMLAGIYSFLGAGWMLVLDAPDVAFTEAAARNLRYFWWLILLVALALWLIWGFRRKQPTGWALSPNWCFLPLL